MRNFKVFVTSALALGSGVSAAIAAVPVDETTPKVIELPTGTTADTGKAHYETFEDSTTTTTTTITSTSTTSTGTTTVWPNGGATESSQASSSMPVMSSAGGMGKHVSPSPHDYSGHQTTATSASAAVTTTTIYHTIVVTIVAQEFVTQYANAIPATTTRPDANVVKRKLSIGWWVHLGVQEWLCEHKNDVSACWVAWYVTKGLDLGITFTTFPTPSVTNAHLLECDIHPKWTNCPETTATDIVAPPNKAAVSSRSINTPFGIGKRAIETEFGVRTERTTITIPASTTTVLFTGTPPLPETSTSYTTLVPSQHNNTVTPKVAVAYEQPHVQKTDTGFATVVTVVETVTIQVQTEKSTTSISPVTTARGPVITTVGSATTTCTSNNTSTDTQSYLNISTSSMTGFTFSVSGETSTAHLATKNSTKIITTSTTATTDGTLGFTGAVTSTLGSDSSKSVEFGGINFPAATFAAMAACFALALLL